MFERLNREARLAVTLSQRESENLGHPWLGTEHLLLALLRQPDTAACRALLSLGVTYEAARRELIDIIGEPSGADPLGAEDASVLRTIGIDLSAVRRIVESTFGRGALDQGCAHPARPMMCRLKESFERAHREAGSGLVEPEDLLLGMLHVKRALAIEVLDRMSITPAAVRARVQALRAKAS